ncbi:MAG: terminase large subunit, partial [Oscillospiraceae bacterium]|nr:terminase large subunit [Oscillospiraceae bacterium]
SLKGRKCYGGLDLSTSEDMTAFVLVFPPEDINDEDDKFIVIPHYWIPEESVKKRSAKERVKYQEWIKSGLLKTTEGAVINYNFVQEEIENLREIYNFREIAYDRWGAGLLRQNLEKARFKMEDFGQGYASMSPASKELMKLVLEEWIAHGGHKILRWNFDNIKVKQDEVGNIKPVKDNKSSSERIDGAIAMIMALQTAIDYLSRKQGGVAVYDFDNNTVTRVGENNYENSESYDERFGYAKKNRDSDNDDKPKEQSYDERFGYN